MSWNPIANKAMKAAEDALARGADPTAAARAVIDQAAPSKDQARAIKTALVDECDKRGVQAP